MAGIGLLLGRTALAMLTSLMTEKFVKKMLIAGLEQIVRRTETAEDDKLLAAAKAEWGIE